MLNFAKKLRQPPFMNRFFASLANHSSTVWHPNYLEIAILWAQEFPSCILEIDPLKLSCRMRMRHDGTNIIRIWAKFSQRQNLQPVDFCPTDDYRSLTHGEPPRQTKGAPHKKRKPPVKKNGARQTFALQKTQARELKSINFTNRFLSLCGATCRVLLLI